MWWWLAVPFVLLLIWEGVRLQVGKRNGVFFLQLIIYPLRRFFEKSKKE